MSESSGSFGFGNQKMSPEAEGLRVELGISLYGYPHAPATEKDIAQVIVSELGITEEMVENLKHLGSCWCYYWQDEKKCFTPSCVNRRQSHKALSTLLEVSRG